MLNSQNRHGPRSDLMQGDDTLRGFFPSCPDCYPLMLIIKPPGNRRTTDLLRSQFDIACGLPVMSQPGCPDAPPPYMTPQPDSQLVTVTVKHNLIDVRGSLCAKHSEFSCQLSAIREPKTKNKEQFLEQRTKNKEQFLEQRTKNSFWNKEPRTKNNLQNLS